MSTKKTTLFALVLLVVLGYIYLYELPHERAEKAAGKTLSGALGKEISSVQIKSAAYQYKLVNSTPVVLTAGERAAAEGVNLVDDDASAAEASSDVLAGQQWSVDGSPYIQFDSANLSALLNTLVSWELGQALPSDDLDKDLAVYGLAAPELTVALQIAGKEHVFEFGKVNQYTSKRYLRVPDKDQIFMASEGTFSALNKKLEELRDKTPVNFAQGDLISISVDSHSGKTESQKFRLEKVGQEWTIAEPKPYSADAEAIETLVTEVSNLSAASFIDDAGDKLAKYDLEKPPVTVTFKTAKAEEVLKISTSANGKADASAGLSTFFKLDSSPVIFRSEGAQVAKFAHPLEYFRKKRFINIGLDLIRSVEFEMSDGKKVNIVKQADDVYQVGDKTADIAFVRTLLSDLVELKAEQYPSDEATVAPRDFGFGKPAMRITIRSASTDPAQAELVTVVAIGVSAKVGEVQGYYVGVGDLAEPFVISSAAFERIVPKEEALLQTARPSPSLMATPNKLP